jgi:hypothetical protein
MTHVYDKLYATADTVITISGEGKTVTIPLETLLRKFDTQKKRDSMSLILGGLLRHPPVEERPVRPCDPDCNRRKTGLDSAECDCSRSEETTYTGPTEPGNLTMDEVLALRAGDQVHWIDPDGGKCSRTVRLASAPVEISDGAVRLNERDSGDFEVFIHELA